MASRGSRAAQSATQSAEQERMRLLEQVMSGDSDARQSLLGALVQDSDPRIRMVAEMMAQQQAATESAAAEDGASDEAHYEAPEPAPDPRRGRRLRGAIERLKQELDFQREIGDTLAAALGACYLCWGGEPVCEECRGQGAPGWASPDLHLFRQYIQPALSRLSASRPRGGNLRDAGAPSHPSQERSPS